MGDVVNKSKYNLLLCEIHFPPIHGKNETSDPNIETHYLLFCKYEPFENEYNELSGYRMCDYDDGNDEYLLEDDLGYLRNILRANTLHQRMFGNHPTIRNYYKICENINNIKPEIGECITLSTGETIVIIKTIWIKIIQRKWKKIMKIRKLILTKRLSQSSIKFMEINGSWPTNCKYMPSIHGMLSELKIN
jgi:hypothetical protein